MKKITAIIIIALFVMLAAVPAFAGSDDATLKSATVDLLADLDGLDENSAFQMRGFTASPDGKFVYGGFLQNLRHVSKIDTSTGAHVGEYDPEIENDDGVTAASNYPKGLAVDCRGYLFVGITHDVPATPYISLACVDTDVDEDGFMTEISYITEKLDGDHTGINGVATQKIGDKVLVYVVTCYDKDTIRCYDVTDVKNMKLEPSFGVNGVVDYNELTGSQSDPGYVAVDVDGYIYLCYKQDGSSYSKGSNVIKIDKDGKSIVNQVEIPEAYGICTAGDYLFVTTYAGVDSKVVVLNKSDLSTVCDLVYPDQINSLSGCSYGGDRLFIGDHGDGTANLPGSVLQTSPLNLKRDPRETETMEKDPSVKPVETTEADTTEPAEPVPTDRIVIADFTDPAVVSKLGGGNNVDLEYDEAEGCLKVTCVGADPFFSLTMKKDQWYDGDKYPILVLVYKTEVEDTRGEIFFTTKEAREIAANHIDYEMESAEDFAECEIDMTMDDQGNWGGQVRSLRIDPATSDEEDIVYYLKTVYAKEEEPVETTEALTTEAETKDNETETTTTEAETTKAEDTKKTPATTTSGTPSKGGPNVGLIIGIIAGVVVVIAAVVVIILKVKKKK